MYHIDRFENHDELVTHMGFIFSCQNPRCRFRFPDGSLSDVHHCPKCGGPLQIIETQAQPILSENNEKVSNPVIDLLLDNIRSAYNVGAIIRTANAVGVQQLHFLGITPTPDNPKVQKTALGSTFGDNWRQYWSYTEFLSVIDRSSYDIYCLEGGSNSQPLFDLQLDQRRRYVLVLGNERNGVDPLIMRECDAVVHLPMLGSKTSLNVSVACGIALYWIRFIAPKKSDK